MRIGLRNFALAALVTASLSTTGCAALMGGMGAPQPEAQGPQEPLTNLEESDFTKHYITACEAYLEKGDEKVKQALNGVAGNAKRVDGTPHKQASPLLAEVIKEDVGAKVVVPERGFPTIQTELLEKIKSFAANPPKTAKGRKEQMAIGQKIGKVQPKINDLNTHLYDIMMAQNDTDVYAQVCSAYPLTAAVALGNARHHNLIEASNEKADREAIRKVIEVSHKARARSAAVMTLFATYQAAVEGAVEPEALDEAVAAGLEGLEAEPEVSDEELDEVMDLAAKALKEARAKEAELKKLAEQTMRPPPPKTDNVDTSGAGDAAGSVLGLLTSLATGNVVGVISNAVDLLPSDSALGSAVQGGKALARGDYRTALKSAQRVAPPNSRLAKGIRAAEGARKKISRR